MADGPDQAPEPIAARVLRETGRFALLQLLSAALGWGAQVALSRLLSQRDFGIFGICSFYVGIGQLLGDGGLGATLLRRKGAVSDEEYRVTVTSLMAVAALFASALWLGSGAIARHNGFGVKDLWALRAMAPLYFFGALRIAPYVRLERELRFADIARIELFGHVGRHITALSVAATIAGPWALLCGQLAGCSLQLIAAYRYAPGWVGLGFSYRVWRPLIAYGSRVQATTLCAYLKDNLSRALLGGILGPAAVGSYDFAISYIELPVTAVNALARVQLPVYARLGPEDPQLFATIRGATRTALLLGLPFLGALALAAPWAIPTIFGPKWSSTQPIVWGLLVNMICSLTLSPMFTLLSAQGRAGLALAVFTVWTGATWVLALGALGVAGSSLAAIAFGQSAASLAVTWFLMRFISRYLGRSLLSGLSKLLVSFGCALLAVRLLETVLETALLRALLFLVLYFGAVALLERELLLREATALVRAVARRR
jgi:lipopolysaccharide exporter